MFIPKIIVFEKGTREYEIGKRIYDTFVDNDKVEMVEEVAANKVKSFFTGETKEQTYLNGKKTLVVSKKRPGVFQTCKPSADYMLPLVSGCMGQCEYCYLHTQLGDKPYVRVNVNIDDILERAKQYIEENRKEDTERVTSFEGSATSDPLCIEPYSESLRKAIIFFANEEFGRFRFVTKYSDVDSLLDIKHNGKTEIRFSINTKRVKEAYEHGTAAIDMRIKAAAKVMKVGYPVGFLIAPIFIYDHWKEEYEELLQNLKAQLPEEPDHPLYFEIITHRYTTRAKNLIQELFPTSTLPMDDETRQYKHGQFGYGKYTYKKDEMQDVKEFFRQKIPEYFPESEIKYIV